MARYRKEVPQSKDHNLAVQTSKNAEEEENWSEENDEEDSKDVSETGEDDKKTDTFPSFAKLKRVRRLPTKSRSSSPGAPT